MINTSHYNMLLTLAATPMGKQACYTGGMEKQAFSMLVGGLPHIAKGLRGAIKGGIDGMFGNGAAGTLKRKIIDGTKTLGSKVGTAVGSAAKYVYNNPYSTIGWLGWPGFIAATGLTGIRGLVNAANAFGGLQQQYGSPQYGNPAQHSIGHDAYGRRHGGFGGFGGYNGYSYNQNPNLSYYPERQQPYQQPQGQLSSQAGQNQGIMSAANYWRSAEGTKALNEWKTQHYNNYLKTQQQYTQNQKVPAGVMNRPAPITTTPTPELPNWGTPNSSTKANNFSTLSLGNNYSFSNSTPQLQLDNKYSLSATPTGLNSMAM